ncbi:MAG TPA: hypothetical protein VGJ00_05200 [Rhabdochlamydiaceae bacterium]
MAVCPGDTGKRQSPTPAALLAISPDLQRAFQAVGHHLPSLWQQGHVRQPHKKALLRTLIDKVVVHRLERSHTNLLSNVTHCMFIGSKR